MSTLLQNTTTVRIRIAIAAAVAASALALAGCGSTATGAATETTTPSAAAAGESVTIEDAWVKAVDSGMTAAFGTLVNDGETDANLVSVTSEASSELQLHETVEDSSGEMVMQEKDGGFIIPAGGDFTLEPGGNHIMIMDVTSPLQAGDEVSFTLTFSDDSTYEFTAPVKDYTGADENYVGGDDSDMGDMDMGDSGTDE